MNVGDFFFTMYSTFKKILIQYFPQYKILLDCQDILYENFGEENVEFGCKNNFLHITIKIPEIEIKNASIKHLLKDVYVRIKFEKTGITLLGTRGKVSIFEYLSAYAHSHLPRNSFADFKDFCLGSGEFWYIKMRMLDNLDSFNLFCLALSTFLAWESIEGVPYVKLKKVKEKELSYKNIPVKVTDIPFVLENFEETLKANIDSIDVENVLGEIKIIKNDNYLTVLRNYFYSYYSEYDLETIFGYFVGDIFYNLESINNSYFSGVNSTTVTNTKSFIFKGEEITLKVEYPDTESVVKDSNFDNAEISPVIVDYITKKIENKLQKSYETVKFRKYKKLCRTA